MPTMCMVLCQSLWEIKKRTYKSLTHQIKIRKREGDITAYNKVKDKTLYKNIQES